MQACNINLSILSCGECWHNNHHAFPESAQIGLEANQKDPSWWVIKKFEKLGIFYDINTPRHQTQRDDLYKN